MPRLHKCRGLSVPLKLGCLAKYRKSKFSVSLLAIATSCRAIGVDKLGVVLLGNYSVGVVFLLLMHAVPPTQTNGRVAAGHCRMSCLSDPCSNPPSKHGPEHQHRCCSNKSSLNQAYQSPIEMALWQNRPCPQVSR